ncbi:MAG: hypothetical protein C4317_07375 [Acidimicrobiia bacterium]
MDMQNATVALEGRLISKGQQAPDFTLETTAGKRVTLSLITPLWPVLVIFFRTRCDACRVLMPRLIKLQHDYGDADIEILAVSQDGKIMTHDFVTDIRWPGRVLVDHPELEASKAFGVELLPAAVLVDTGMVVRATADASDLDSFERLTEEVAALVGWPYKPLLLYDIEPVGPCPSKAMQAIE